MHRHLKGALVALVLTLALPAAAHAAIPGVNVAAPAQIPAAVNTGAQEIRLFIHWGSFEPNSSGQFLNSAAGTPAGDVRDQTLASIKVAKDAGRRVLVVVTDSPDWANNNAGAAAPPSNPDEFGRFARDFVKKARDVGAPIDALEVWNEPDLSGLWTPAAYTALLKSTYAAVKSAEGDRSVAVVTGPTAGNNYPWIQALYDNGAKGSFDAVAVHTDTACLTASPDSFYRDPAQGNRLGQFTFLGYREVRATMLANGDDKPIFMSELGWSSTGGAANSCTRGSFAGQKPDGVDAATQAAFLAKAYQCVANDPYVAVADWFTLFDGAGNAINEFNHYGLLDAAGGAKPAASAFAGVLNNNGAGPCGDFTPPAVSIVSPTPGQQFDDRIDVRASASDGGVGLGRISFFVDGGGDSIRNFTDGLSNGAVVGLTPWFGSRDLAVGMHTVRVVAVDNNGNAGEASVVVEKVAPGAVKATLLPRLVSPKKVLGKNCKKRFRRGKASCTADFGSFFKPPGATAATPSIQGKARFEWYWYNAKIAKKNKKLAKRKRQDPWRKLAGSLVPANKRIKATAKLIKKGKWKVHVAYLGAGSYKPFTSKFVTFTIR